MGNNVLNGAAGADTLIRGLGNDVYVVGDVGEVVVETPERAPTRSNLDQLCARDNVENLTLTGSAAINGAGNDLNNVMTGNAAGNVLSGGLGNDTMNGGVSADTLIGAQATMSTPWITPATWRWKASTKGPISSTHRFPTLYPRRGESDPHRDGGDRRHGQCAR